LSQNRKEVRLLASPRNVDVTISSLSSKLPLRPTFFPDFQHENKEKGWPQGFVWLIE
jgi:hypothetical protein